MYVPLRGAELIRSFGFKQRLRADAFGPALAGRSGHVVSGWSLLREALRRAKRGKSVVPPFFRCKHPMNYTLRGNRSAIRLTV